MIRAVAVIPAAPALIPELMGAAAAEAEPVRGRARTALHTVATVVSGGARTSSGARLVVVGRADADQDRAVGTRDLAGPLTDQTFGPPLDLPALDERPGPGQSTEASSTPRPSEAVAPSPSDTAPGRVPTPLLVARRLVADVVAADPAAASLWTRAEWIALTPDTVSAFADELARTETPVGLVLLADGAACHGPKAPRREDPRAQEYDDQVAKALSVADPVAFAELDPAVGRELGAEGADLWPLLEAVAADTRGTADGWRAELTWRGAPYGVGWFVATWLR